MLSLDEIEISLLPLLPDELLGARASALLGLLPAASLKPNVTRCTNAQLSPGHIHCSLHTFRHNIYTWPLHVALFQINGCTIYLLGFYSFSVLQPALQLYPNFWLGHVTEPFMDSQHRSGHATRPAPSPGSGFSAQATGEQLSTYGVPSCCFLHAGKAYSPMTQTCRCLTKWGKALKGETRSQVEQIDLGAHNADPLPSTRQILGCVLSQELSNS